MNEPREGRWRIAAAYPGLAWLQSQATAFLAEAGIEPRPAQRMLLALDELAANLVEHASAAVETFDVQLTCRSDAVELMLIDAGPPFDPCESSSPAAAATLDELPVGGIGLVLVRRLCKSLHYERMDGQNRLRLVFTRDAGTEPAPS